MKKFTPHLWFLWSSLPFLLLQTIITFAWATPSVSEPLGSSFFVFSRSQIILSMAALFVFISFIYFIMKKMERQLHQGLNILHYVCTMLAILILTTGMMISDFFTRSNTLNSEAQLFDYQTLNKFFAAAAFILLFGQIVFIINCLRGIFKKKFI